MALKEIDLGNVRGPSGPTGAKGVSMRLKGAWSSSIAYVNDGAYIDLVTSGGNTYACKQSNTNQPVSNSTYWELIAQKGATGAQGQPGATYTHPSTHPASMITEDSTHKFVTAEEKKLIEASKSKMEQTSFIKVSAGTGQIAQNGQITKVQLQNIIDRTSGIVMSNYGVVVPENCNKALVEMCSGWGTGVNGDLEHRLHIAQTTADSTGSGQIQYRDGKRTPANTSIESILHSCFTVEGLKAGNVLYMNVVQISGESRIIGNISYMRVTFYH